MKRQDAVRPNVVRIIFGTIVGYLCPLIVIALFVIGNNLSGFFFFTDPVENGMAMFWKVIFFIPFLLIGCTFMFYAYGWIHKTMYLLCGHVDWYIRIPGKIIGGIGYVIPPWVLMVWGHNKKWLYFYLVGIPSILIGGVFLLNYFNVININWEIAMWNLNFKQYSLPIAIPFLMNGLFALCTKRCRHCGAMMTEIVHELDGKSHDKYASYDGVDFCGDNLAIGKYYVCTNCYYVKKGIGFSVQTDGYVD